MHVPPSSYPGSSIASCCLKDEKLGRGTQIIAKIYTFKTAHQNTCFKYSRVGIVHSPQGGLDHARCCSSVLHSILPV